MKKKRRVVNAPVWRVDAAVVHGPDGGFAAFTHQYEKYLLNVARSGAIENGSDYELVLRRKRGAQ